MFFPIYIDEKTGMYHSTGEPPPAEVQPEDVPSPPGTLPIWPIDQSGQELMWRLSPPSLREYLGIGHAKFGKRDKKTKLRSVSYLQSGIRQMLKSGEVALVGKEAEGALKLEFADDFGTRNPATLWNLVAHSASEHGAGLLKSLVPSRRFPYPKSIYAVEDCLRFVVGRKQDAIILDFFSGSGTTAHAVMRLNRQDDGSRQCISITNNEVAADEQSTLRKAGLRPGDPEWEKWGICDYITKPRIAAAITGQTPDGKAIAGDYKFTDEFPMAEGFEENAEFFTLTYEAPVAVSHNLAFQRVALLLWMRAGSEGRRINDLPAQGWEVADTYGLLVDLDRTTEFCAAALASDGLRVAYVVTDDDRRFQAVARALPDTIEPVRLYESYLSNFRFAMGR
jgi:adenine-specific DNA-methyltransferase